MISMSSPRSICTYSPLTLFVFGTLLLIVPSPKILPFSVHHASSLEEPALLSKTFHPGTSSDHHSDDHVIPP